MPSRAVHSFGLDTVQAQIAPASLVQWNLLVLAYALSVAATLEAGGFQVKAGLTEDCLLYARDDLSQVHHICQ